MVPPLHWNGKQYVDAHGHIIAAAEIRQHIDDYISSEQSEVDIHTKALLAGSITVATFFSWMKEKVRGWHHVAGVIAYGGEDQMNAQRWVRVGQKVQSELDYLAAFEAEAVKSAKATESIAQAVERAVQQSAAIPDGLEAVARQRVEQAMFGASPSTARAEIAKSVVSAVADSIGTEEAVVVSKTIAEEVIAPFDELIWGQVGSRGRMYADASYSTYVNSERAREGDAGATGVRRICAEDEASCDECVAAAGDDYLPMDEIADIGSLTCMNNCRCSFEFSYHGIEPLEIDRNVYA